MPEDKSKWFMPPLPKDVIDTRKSMEDFSRQCREWNDLQVKRQRKRSAEISAETKRVCALYRKRVTEG